MARPRSAALHVADTEQPAPGFELTPERQVLAAAIAALAASQARNNGWAPTLSELDDVSFKVSIALRDAERVLERTQSLASSTYAPPQRPPASFWSQEAVEEYEAEQNTPPVPIGEARQAVELAKEAKQSADAAATFHRMQGGRLVEDIRRKQAEVRRACRLVIKSDPALAALAEEAKDLATRAQAAARAFAIATDGDSMPSDSPFYRCTEPANYRERPADWALPDAWQAALEQLSTDPSTPLPMPGAV